MFNPQYRLVINLNSFPNDQCICLGSQLISIVHCLNNILPFHVWYGADVDAVGSGARDLNICGFQLNVIGSDEKLIEYCSKINQFIWGEFVCIDNNYSPQSIQVVELATEDPPFRPISCQGVLVEIRMFDTSFIEIYSENGIVLKKLSNVYLHSTLESIVDKV